MNDLLTDLLERESSSLPVPPAPAADILRRARGRRRRRQVLVSGSTAAVVVAAVGVALLAPTKVTVPRTTPASLPAAAATAYADSGAVSVGSTVYFGATDDYAIDTHEKIKSVYYTSAGVLVRTGDVAYLDDDGPSRYLLVRPDGSTQRLPLDLGDRAPSTDPGQPYLAYADRSGGEWQVVVYDVEQDRRVASVPLEGDFTWGGWLAPPVALSGDHVYVGMDDGMVDVDWRTGTVGDPDPDGASTFPEVSGRSVLRADENAQLTRTQLSVDDVRTGAPLLSLDLHGWGAGFLSPSGSYVAVAVADRGSGLGPAQVGSFVVYDLATGRHIEVSGPSVGGWTPEDQLMFVTTDAVRLCAADTGRCRTTRVDLGHGQVKVGGRSYES